MSTDYPVARMLDGRRYVLFIKDAGERERKRQAIYRAARKANVKIYTRTRGYDGRLEVQAQS